MEIAVIPSIAQARQTGHKYSTIDLYKGRYHTNTMKQISIKPYIVHVKKEDGSSADMPYNVRESLVELLFAPALKLKAVDLLKQNTLADKILKSPEDLLLEEEEYTRVVAAINSIEGLGRNEVELVRRVLEAPAIEVTGK